MPVAVGIDVAKETHWAVIKVAQTGQVLASHAVGNTPQAIAGLVDEVCAAEAEHGPATVGIDILGGIAALAEAMLLAGGLTVVHVPGRAVNRARQGTRGGQHKSDPKDAAVIADLIRMRDDLRVVDVTTKTGLHLLTRYVTPAQIRRAGRARLLAWLRRAGHVKNATLTALAGAAVAAARAQAIAVPGEQVAAELIRGLAAEALAGRQQLQAIDARIEEALARHPDAALIRSLPGMGAILTAEYLAVTGGIGRFPDGNKLAAAAGLAPALRQSGKVRYLERGTGGDRALKRVFYQSAFIAAGCDPASKAYYARKRSEGKTHHQAVLALARRRVNVLHAMLRNRTPYQPGHTTAAA